MAPRYARIAARPALDMTTAIETMVFVFIRADLRGHGCVRRTSATANPCSSAFTGSGTA